MADAVGQAEVGKEGKGPAGMTCLVYNVLNGSPLRRRHMAGDDNNDSVAPKNERTENRPRPT